MIPGTARVGGRAGESPLGTQVSLRARTAQARSLAGASRTWAPASEEPQAPRKVP